MLAIEEALYNQLKSGTALTALLGGTAIYNQLAPAGTAISYPVVIFTESAGVEDNDSPRRCKTMTYQVTAISDTSKKEAVQIDDAIDTLLHGGTLSITGWSDYWMMRQSDVSYVEQVSGGRVLWHEGGLYRIRISS